MEQEKSRQFEDLYNKYLVPLKKLAVCIGVGYDDIEDIVHDTMLTYLERYPMDWSDKQKKAMLAKILRSKKIDTFRKSSHCTEIKVDDTEDVYLVMMRLIEKDTLTYVTENETYREVLNQVNSMKKDWRDVMILHIVEDRPIKEVCQILDIPETVCRSRLSRARKHLREVLKDSSDL